ncbi:pyridoxamine 5'-phosphate oxidase family protein [Bacillus daqingensis]|uniref:Pyridoxamine 5'-phosphate oxidase family protein n=1 Tax=Bacillus daqingensis TaxID=872396 RepID=A0ABV9NWE4_9BACI
MKIIRDVGTGVDLDAVLAKPLVAHLATSAPEGPRDSPLWFLWEKERLWIIGTAGDTFPERVRQTAACAMGIVDFDASSGTFIHIGFRGTADVKPFDKQRADRLLAKYLGPERAAWDPRFQALGQENVLICFQPESVVVRDQSYQPLSPIRE